MNIIPCASQEAISDVERLLQTLIEDFTEFTDGGEDFDFNTLYEEILLRYNNKIDLNKAAASEFEQLFFLSDADVQNILTYRSNYGPFVSIYELQAVPGLSNEKNNWLRYFVQLSDHSSGARALTVSELNSAQNQLFIKWKYQVETARGFLSENGAPPKYIGNKHHLYTRYAHLTDRQRLGIIIEKDPGENLFNNRSETGLDYLSFHYQIKRPANWIEQLNVGDYSVSMGQGLVAHSAFGLGKSSLTTTVKKGGHPIRAFNSVVENLAFRGVAATINPDNSNLSGALFISYAPRDANILAADSLGISRFSSLPQGGLHRTEGEREDQDAVYETTIGAKVNYNFKGDFRIGMNTIHHSFDKSLKPGTQLYQLYRWRGDQLSNYSIDYNGLIGGWNLFGELAHSRHGADGGWAQIHGLIKTLDPKMDVSLVYRDYGVKYQSLYANGFGENPTVNNERGLYLGLEYRPSRLWRIRAYADRWKNDWLRFRVDGPGEGTEYLLRLDYKERRKRHYYLQYRHETKSENSDAELRIDIPVPKTIQRLRLHANHNLGDGLELRSRLEFSYYKKEENSEHGWLAYQDFIYRRVNTPWRLSTRLAYFDISDFDSRIYTYENDLLFEYYIPSFSGNGLRYYVHFRYDLTYSLMAEIRWEQTHFLNAETIRSNNDLIEGNTLSRVKLQVRWRF